MDKADSDRTTKVTMASEGGGGAASAVRPSPSELVRRMESHVADMRLLAAGHIAVEMSERVTDRRVAVAASASRGVVAASRHRELHARLCQLAPWLNAACATKEHSDSDFALGDGSAAECDGDVGGDAAAQPHAMVLWSADEAMPIMDLALLVIDYNEAKRLFAEIGEHMAANRLADADAAANKAWTLVDRIWTQLEEHERDHSSLHDMATAIDDHEQGTAPASGHHAAGTVQAQRRGADALAQSAGQGHDAQPDGKPHAKRNVGKVQPSHYARGAVGNRPNAKRGSRPKKPSGGCCDCAIM